MSTNSLPMIRQIGLAGSLMLGCVSNLNAEETQNRFRFELGGGLSTSPTYEGASDYLFSPYPTVRIIGLETGRLNIGGDKSLGWRFGPSFKFRGERKQSDDQALLGTNDVDSSLEVGLSVGYEWQYMGAFVRSRYGVTGHNGFVGEAGIDAIVRPDDKTRITVGPRLSFADEQYMNTYFSVPSSAVSLSQYDADGGIKSVGAEITFRHDFNPHWAFEANAQYDRLIKDAARSPIVEEGSRNQFSARIGIVRKFDWRW